MDTTPATSNLLLPGPLTAAIILWAFPRLPEYLVALRS